MPVKSSQFVVVHHYTLIGLELEIAVYVSDGWEPIGCPFWTPENGGHWCQSLFKRV